MADLKSIPTWMDMPATVAVSPPVDSLKQSLPFGELSWDNFERLCLRLARREADVESCQLYGVRGDKQEGIDIFARTGTSVKYRVYQCKREEKFGAAKIKKAVAKFSEGTWKDKSDTFVLCTKESLQSQQRCDAFEEQVEVLKRDGITLVSWDSNQLSMELKKPCNHDLVDEFFGREWVRLFCGKDFVEHLTRRLTTQQVATFRSRLGEFYRRVFNTHDPGLPKSELSARAVLAIEQRFVFPDVIDRRSVVANAMDTSPGSDQLLQTDAVSTHYFDNLRDQSRPMRKESSVIRTVAERTAIDRWLATGEKALLLGVPGSGKSTLLRFLTMDLLDSTPRMQHTCRHWGRHLPVWLPFALWTKTIANRPNESSLSDVLRLWLSSFDEDRLWPIVEAAINDDRLLLIVDGLDEWESEETAGIALNKLQVFVEQRNIPVVASSRPGGFRKLGIPTDQWQVADLADFSTDQQRQLAATWFAQSQNTTVDHHSRNTDDNVDRITFETDSFMAELERSFDLRELAKVPLLLLLLIYHRLQRSSLPNGRFKAYESIVTHLIETHPHRRRVAATVHNVDPELSDDDVGRALAFVAYHLQCHDTGGVVDIQDAISVLEKFMRDEHHGFGLSHPDSRRLSRRILDIGEGSIGLLVRRSNHEIAFFHRSFQEYLAAVHLCELSLAEQISVIKEQSGNPQWHETIMSLFHLTRRSQDLKSFVEIIEEQYATATVFEQMEIEAVLAEIAFGSFGCSPGDAQQIAESTFTRIERGDWMPQRERLLRIALEGCRTTVVKERVKQKITQWFPCRLKLRGEVYTAMSDWSYSNEVIQCLWSGIYDDEFFNQRPAAKALCKLADGNQQIGDECWLRKSWP
ncbi:NACHT domain-containing protein [Bremerella cremea]|uniref:NACHT domain-containing protein n=1 Tax=Bremerella cremea TaxID=1031537 RepID=A0A368KS90_9BACT|nr:NACHT domain-containing protein [Bremerella cremea]RCS46488.1 NACHT domain-containing protein [Bremerella cremea]